MKKALYILGQLNDHDIEWLIKNGRQRAVESGSAIIIQGQSVESLFIVLDGTFVVIDDSHDGKEIARLGSGEIVGEMSFVDTRPPMATVTALENSKVLELSRSILTEKLNLDTGFAARFYRALSIFLSYRMRDTVGRQGYGDAIDVIESDELDMNVLDNLDLAGTRFETILRRLNER